MPRELVTVTVGQCGNQIGAKFWDMALREHAEHNQLGLFDESMSTFFRNCDTRWVADLSLHVANCSPLSLSVPLHLTK
jgi:tubulin epsilon